MSVSYEGRLIYCDGNLCQAAVALPVGLRSVLVPTPSTADAGGVLAASLGAAQDELGVGAGDELGDVELHAVALPGRLAEQRRAAVRVGVAARHRRCRRADRTAAGRARGQAARKERTR